jgi:hypothetical protein
MKYVLNVVYENQMKMAVDALVEKLLLECGIIQNRHQNIN